MTAKATQSTRSMGKGHQILLAVIVGAGLTAVTIMTAAGTWHVAGPRPHDRVRGTVGDLAQGAGLDAGARNTTSLSVSRAAAEVDRSSVRTRSQVAIPVTDRPAGAERGRETRTIYIAGSPEAAMRAWAGLYEADAVGVHFGMPPSNAAVVLAGSAEEALAQRLIADAEAIRDALHLSLPPIAVIDLRSP